ncbi:YidB family protein [Acinetobacter sp. Colony158]|uniref:YidB family protein n=1 Tax=Acinetobacter sp. Colony158 TaxID=2810070 RepID=UPI001C4D9B18|nr:YidB family protein [Acinetobacter sp. Colony158]
MTDLTNIVQILAKQAMGGQQSSQGGLGGILGSVLGQLGANQQTQNQGNTQTQNTDVGLGGILGSVLNQFGVGANNQGSSNQSSSNSSGGSTQALLIAVVPLILAWIQQQGGLQGALDKLRNIGLGSQVQSWVDPEQSNNHIAPQNVQELFDDQQVEQVAEQTQVPKQDIYGAISSVLPQIINSLTPQGDQTNPQEANQDIQNVLNIVSGFLKK